MWNKKLCIGTNSQFGIPHEKQLELFKNAGFDAFFSEWSYNSDIKKWRETADSLGLEFQSIHAPYYNCDKLWQTGEKAAEATNELIDCLRACAEIRVPIMVTHAFIGFDSHTPTKEGLENYGKVVSAAEALGVKLAFENTEGEEYLAALFEKFGDSEAVGLCWDTGHELCYNHGKDIPGLYGKKLFCTHLNDNLGIRDYDGRITYIDDLHLLPFDGIADWNDIASRLRRANFDGILTFELNTGSKPGRHENDCYKRMPIEEYIAEAYKRACRVAQLVMKEG